MVALLTLLGELLYGQLLESVSNIAPECLPASKSSNRSHVKLVLDKGKNQNTVSEKFQKEKFKKLIKLQLKKQRGMYGSINEKRSCRVACSDGCCTPTILQAWETVEPPMVIRLTKFQCQSASATTNHCHWNRLFLNYCRFPPERGTNLKQTAALEPGHQSATA